MEGMEHRTKLVLFLVLSIPPNFTQTLAFLTLGMNTFITAIKYQLYKDQTLGQLAITLLSLPKPTII